MFRLIALFTLAVLLTLGNGDKNKSKTQSVPDEEDKLKEAPLAPGINDDGKKKDKEEKQAKNVTELLQDEKIRGFIKLYNFAIKHGKLNLTETLKNLTNLNETISLANFTKTLDNDKTNPTSVKLPAKSGAKLTNKAKQEAAAEEGSGEEHEGKEKGDHNDDEWSESWDDDNNNGDGNNYSYHDEYYGGNGHGYGYTNDNGEINGHGYQYQYDSPPGMGSMTSTPMNMAAVPMMETGELSQDGFESEFTPHGSFGTHTLENDNPGEYNQQGFVNFDDGTSQYVGNGNYDKKKHIHKLKKAGKRHHNKVHSRVVHLHTNAKHHHFTSKETKKLATIKKHQIEGNGYRRTIMIGNRVCGTKKSTNIQTRDEIHDNNERDINMAKRDIRSHRDTKQQIEDVATIQATDQCCAEHYECPRIVPAKTIKYGYNNDIEYDIMACACDAKFRNCLKNANSYTADAVGHLYFNTLKIPCLTFEHDSADQKSDQPQAPQESYNIVSIVPDAETDRETVGGAQLVVSPAGAHHAVNHLSKDPETEHELHEGSQQTERIQHEEMSQVNSPKELVKETQQETHLQNLLKETRRQKAVFHVIRDGKEDEDADEASQQLQRKNRRPESVINPNPSPNKNPFNQKVRGIITSQEAYLPKTSLSQ